MKAQKGPFDHNTQQLKIKELQLYETKTTLEHIPEIKYTRWIFSTLFLHIQVDIT